MPGISFNSEEEKLKIQQLGLNRPDENALKLGEQFKREIESHYTPKLSIRFINENVGHGAFLDEPIEAGAYVGEYTGVIRENVRIYFTPLNNYLMEYPIKDHRGRNLVIDAENGNQCRFINHSFTPNLKADYALIDGFYHAIFLSLRRIEKGEQITYNYGANYWLLRGTPEEF